MLVIFFYIGSTFEKLSQRMERCGAGYKIYVDGKETFTTSSKICNELPKRKL